MIVVRREALILIKILDLEERKCTNCKAEVSFFVLSAVQWPKTSVKEEDHSTNMSRYYVQSNLDQGMQYTYTITKVQCNVFQLWSESPHHCSVCRWIHSLVSHSQRGHQQRAMYSCSILHLMALHSLICNLKLEQKWRTRAHASVGDANHVTKSHVVMLK